MLKVAKQDSNDYNELKVPKNDINLGKMENIIGDEGHGALKKIIIDFIEDSQS